MKLSKFLILVLMLFSSCGSLKKTEFDQISLQQNILLVDSNDDMNIEERVIICDQYSDTIYQNIDLLNLEKQMLQCIANKNYFEQDYDASDMIFILENSHMGKWKFLFPEENKYRGENLFLFFMENANNFEEIISVMDNQNYPIGKKYFRYVKLMIFSYNGLSSFDEYISWYENRNEDIKAESIEWITRVTALSHEEFILEKAKYHYKIMLYALNNNHIKLKNHGEL